MEKEEIIYMAPERPLPIEPLSEVLGGKKDAPAHQYIRDISKDQFPRIERVPDEVEIQNRSTRYDQQGVDVAFAKESLKLIEEELSRPRYRELIGENHLEAFYLNSSDPIELLHDRIDVEGEHVITVGGSSDFAKIFIDKDARQVDIFDVSLPGVFYNELCLVALRELNFEDFKRFINIWRLNEGRPWDQNLDNLTIFDEQGYAPLRPFLSEQARAYFDELINQPRLFKAGGRVNYEFAQSRRERDHYGPIGSRKYPTVISEVITDEKQYDKLQERARNVDLSFSWASAKAMAEHIAGANNIEDFPVLGPSQREALFDNEATKRFAGADTVYLSNIDYQPEQQIKLAKLFLEAGVRRVLMACRDIGYQASDKFLDSSDTIIKKEPYNQKDREWLEKHHATVRKLRYFGENHEPILPGSIIEYEGVEVHVIDYNDKVEFGMVVEIRNNK